MAVTPSFGLRYPACPDCQPCPNCPGGLDAFENLARDTDTALASVAAQEAADVASLDSRVDVLEAPIIGRGRRTTDKTAITVEVGVLRLDGKTVKNGHLYRIGCTDVTWTAPADNHVGRLSYRIDTTGAAATTASALLHFADAAVGSSFVGQSGQTFDTLYAPGANLTLSVLLTATRIGGASAMTLEIGADHPLDMYIEDLGLDPGDTGVVI